MKKYLKCIAAYGSAFLISLIGIVWQIKWPNNTIIITFAVLAAIPILLLVANIILAKQYMKKINRTRVADMQEYMLRHRNEAEKTYYTMHKKLQMMRYTTIFYEVLIWILAACASLLGGMLYTIASGFIYPCILYAGTIFYAVYVRIEKREPVKLNDNALVLKREEYPHLYDIAYRAAQTLECNGEITILLSLDCNASIVRDVKKYYLNIGIVLLNILSEEELYCICLHEFSHYSETNQRAERENRYGTWLSSDRNIPRPFAFVSGLFMFFDIRYMFDHMTYQYATSVIRETEADLGMAKYGSPEAAASALLKINYDEKFCWESGVQNEAPAYIAEEPNPHVLSDYIARFKDAINKRHEEWDAMIEREILPNNASHPILKMRLKTLGVERAELIPDKSSSAYRSEIQSALNYADKKFCEMQDTYEQDRKERYLAPLNRVTEWENNGMPVTAETYADIVSDLRQIGRHEDAEAFCERVIQELDENSSPYAYLIKGNALIRRYDESGIDLIYLALENNNNYLDEGLELIGEFYCMMGMEEKLLDYRQRAVQLSQKNKDEYSEANFLSKNDKLSCDHMPDGMLEEILAYIRSIDEDIIQNIYLVRKTISDTFFTSAFVIQFHAGTDAQRGEVMHKIFCYLDTYPSDWQFSLFDYVDYPNIKFDKIEGSLVYSKSDNK